MRNIFASFHMGWKNSAHMMDWNMGEHFYPMIFGILMMCLCLLVVMKVYKRIRTSYSPSDHPTTKFDSARETFNDTQSINQIGASLINANRMHLEKVSSYCFNCGNPLPSSEIRFCPNCGVNFK
jgi:hypothetical protein